MAQTFAALQTARVLRTSSESCLRTVQRSSYAEASLTLRVSVLTCPENTNPKRKRGNDLPFGLVCASLRLVRDYGQRAKKLAVVTIFWVAFWRRSLYGGMYYPASRTEHSPKVDFCRGFLSFLKSAREKTREWLVRGMTSLGTTHHSLTHHSLF